MHCHISLCAVYKYDGEIMSHTFTQNLVIQTLDSVPGLRTLHLTQPSREDNTAQLARMIYQVWHLQTFTYLYDCTDKVVEQLELHCSGLKELDLDISRGVTNASVQHLLHLGKLEFKNSDGTQIYSKHYGLLLSELPIIKNITFRKIEKNILDQVHRISSIL
jgi:hypothetical protein